MVVELKKNKRAFDSQVKIYKALRQVLLRKPLIDVTVTDIEKNAVFQDQHFIVIIKIWLKY